ncbi:RAB11 family interacting protein 1 (Class I) b [Balamuthia mandrillaris]
MSLFSHLLAFVLGGIFFLGGSVTLLIWLLAKKTKKNERYLRAKVPQIRLEDPSEQQNAQVRRPDKVSSASTISSSNVSSNVPSSASSGSSIREPENVPSSSRQKKKAIKKQKKEEKELEKQQRQKEKKDREEEKKREKEMKKQKQQQPQNVHAATSAATAAVMATAISSRRGSTVPSSASSSSSASLSFSEQQLMNASRANENEAHALPSLAVSAPDSGLPSTTSFSSSSNTSTSTPSFTTASSFENINSHHSFNESDSASTITTEEPSSSDLTSATTTPVSSTEQLLPPSNLRSHSIPKRAATIAGAPMGLAKALDKARKKSLAHYSDSMPAPFFPGRGSTSAFATPEGEDGAAEQQQPPNNPFFQDKIIAKSGWLHLKRAKFFYKRWCVLVDDQIAYLSSPKSKTIRGLIKLEGCRTIALKERTFKIAHPEKQRIFTRKIKEGQDEDDGEDSSDEEELVEPSFFSPASSSPSALPQQDGRKNSESIKKEEKKRMKKEQKDEEKERKRAEKEKKKSATFSKKTGRASGEVFVTPKRNSSDNIAKEKDKGGLPSSYSNDDITSIDINNQQQKQVKVL